MKILVFDENFLLEPSVDRDGTYTVIAKGGNTYDQFQLGDIVIIESDKVRSSPFLNNKYYVIVEEAAILGKVVKDA